MAQTVLNPEKDLISGLDPLFGSALPCDSFRRSQSASACISCTVILRPWMFKLHFTPSHILSLFPGFMQVSVILACAGLCEVCPFLSAMASQRRALLIFHHLSSVRVPLLLLLRDQPAQTGPLSPSGVQAAVAAVSHSQPSRHPGCKNKRETCDDLC